MNGEEVQGCGNGGDRLLDFLKLPKYVEGDGYG